MLSDHAIAHIGQYALIKNSKNQVLVLEHNNGQKICGLPGGRLEEGERWDESLLREVKEEAHIECSNPMPFMVHTIMEGEFLKYCIYFLVEAKKPFRAKTGDSNCRVRWISYKTAKKENFFTTELKNVVLSFLEKEAPDKKG